MHACLKYAADEYSARIVRTTFVGGSRFYYVTFFCGPKFFAWQSLNSAGL